jgi:hypothetical protein
MRRHRVIGRPTATQLPRPLVALAVSCAVVLTACGDPDAADDASPLEALFGTNMSPAEQRAQQLEQEEVVATCMREAGFEYTPVDWGAQFPDQPEGEPTSAREFGERYGYGVAHNYELYEWPYLDADGNYVDGGGGPGGEFEDPNQDYVNSLGPDEIEEYYATLYGDQSETMPEIDPVTGEEVYTPPPLEEQGCYGQAQLEVVGEQLWNDEDFNERMNQYYEDLENDPRLEDAEILWSDCMYEIDEEYDFFGPDDMYQYVNGLFQEAKGLEEVEVDPDTGEIIGRPGEFSEYGYSYEEGADVAIGYEGEQKRLTEEEIRAFQEREIEMWRDDQQCQEESGLLEIRRQIEEELVDAIREEFPDLIEAAEEA